MFINNALINGKFKNIIITDGVITKITEESVPNGVDAK